jgi:hypothetical protein
MKIKSNKTILLIAYENDYVNYINLYNSFKRSGYKVCVVIGDFFSVITGHDEVKKALIKGGVDKDDIFDFREELVGINYITTFTPDYEYLKDLEASFLGEKTISHLIYADIYMSGMLHNRDDMFRPKNKDVLYVLVEKIIKKINHYIKVISPDLIFTFGSYNFIRNYFYEKSLIDNILFLSLTPVRINNICMLADRSIFELSTSIQDEMLFLQKECDDHAFDKANRYINKIKKDQSSAYDIKKYDYNHNLNEKLSFRYQVRPIFRAFLSLPRSYINDYKTLFRGGWNRNYFYLKSPLYIFYLSIRAAYRNWLYFKDKNLNHEKLPDADYVFYSLHTLPEDGVFTQVKLYDELFNIMRLSKVLPIGYKLVIKVHTTMLLRNAAPYPIDWFNRINNMHNTYFISPLVDGVDIVSNSKAVATVCGTSLLEAAIMGKPAFSFGNPEFSILDGVYEFSENDFVKNIKSHNLPVVNNHKYYIQAFFNKGIDVDLTKFEMIEESKSKTNEYKNDFIKEIKDSVIEILEKK